MKAMTLLSLLLAVLLSGCKQDAAPPSAPAPAQATATTPSSGVNASDAVSLYKAQLESTPKFNAGTEIAARIGDWSITVDELDRKAGPEHLRRLKAVYDDRFHELEKVLQVQLYEQEAKSQGMTGKDLFEKKMKAVKVAPDPAKYKDVPADEKQAAIEKDVRATMYEAHQKYLAELARKWGVRITMGEPEALKDVSLIGGADKSEIVIGAADSNVLVEVYTDFQCPYCKAAAPSIDKMVRTYSEQAKFVFRPVVNPAHPASRPAAVIAMCVYRQSPGKFLDFQNAVFDRQDDLAGGMPIIKSIAAQVGADMDAIESCSANPDVRDALDRGTNEAMDRGISNTPTVLVGDVPLVGDQGFAEYQRAMMAVISQAQSARK